MPLPHDAAQPIPAPRPRLSTVGFFGHQRPEKGSPRLDGLVAEFLANDFDVIVQDSGSQTKPPQTSPRVRRYGFVSDLAALLTETDFVILPYDPQAFRARCSGIASQAIACGVPVLAPDNTAIAQVLKRYDTGLVYTNSADIVPLIVEARANYRGFADRAWRAAAVWAQENGIEQHAMALLNQAVEPGSRP